MSAKFLPNPIGIKAIQYDEDLAEVLEGIAEEIQGHAESLAPVGDEADPDGTRYRDSFETDHGVDESSAYGRVNSFDPIANLLEWGSVNNPAFATLRRAAERVVGPNLKGE